MLVGNEPGAAGLECQFVGPTLKFQRAGVIAVTGADMQPKLDGSRSRCGRASRSQAGQTLALSFAKSGARGYIAIAGGIDTPPWLGSQSTFHKAGVGGMDGHAIKAGQVVPVARADGKPGRRVKDAARPPISTDRRWTIEAVAGPNDDWIDRGGA